MGFLTKFSNIMSKYIFICLFIFNSTVTISQTKLKFKTNGINNLIVCDSIFADIHKFMLKNEVVAENEDYPLYLINLLTFNEYELNEGEGIYLFGLKSADPIYALLFKNNDGSLVFEVSKNLPKILKALTYFFNKNNFINKEEQALYTLGILKYFNSLNNDLLIPDNCLPHKWDSCYEMNEEK